MHIRIGREIGGEALGILALGEVVEFAAQRHGKVRHQTRQVVVLGGLPAAADAVSQILQDREIGLDDLVDLRSSDLDHYLGAVGQGGEMGLADGRAGQRLGGEAGKDLIGQGAEFFFDQLVDGGRGNGRCRILQLGQLAQVGRRHDVGPSREQLTELDEGGTEFFERESQVIGGGVRLVPALVSEYTAVERNQSAQTAHPDDEPQSVPAEDLADLPVPIKLTLSRVQSHRSNWVDRCAASVRRPVRTISPRPKATAVRSSPVLRWRSSTR